MQDMFDEAFWNERYSSKPQLWSGNPNNHLVAEASDLTPGTALDVGCGEGGDAIWLAKRGWQVTAVDISTVAIERATANAGALPITWAPTDLIGWDPAPARYDLISAQYMHLPPDARNALFSNLAAAVTPGGTLLIVCHHPSDMEISPQPHPRDMYYTGDDVAALLDLAEWDVVTNTAAPREVTLPEGRQVTHHDTVFRARRRH